MVAAFVLPQSPGSPLTPLMWVAPAVVIVGLVLALTRPELLRGSPCPGTTGLQEARVVAAGAGIVAVRTADDRRWAWRVVPREPLPRPADRVWIDSELTVTRPSPLLTAEPQPRVLWPESEAGADRPLTFGGSGDGTADETADESHEAQVRADAVAAGRKSMRFHGGFLTFGVLTGIFPFGATITSSGIAAVQLAQALSITVGAVLMSGPAFLAARQLATTRRLRRVQVARTQRGSRFLPITQVTVRVEAPAGPQAGAQAWAWDSPHVVPGLAGGREVWIPQEAAPGDYVVAFVPDPGPMTRRRILMPATRADVVRDLESDLGSSRGDSGNPGGSGDSGSDSGPADRRDPRAPS